MMAPVVKAALDKEEMSGFHEKLRDRAMYLLGLSKNVMSRKYSDWDDAVLTFRGKRTLDEEDVRAREKDEPVKMVIPLTYSQVMTYVSFMFMLFSQRQRFYELKAIGWEDAITVDTCERLLDLDLKRNMWPSKLFQWLLDIARMSCGVLKHSWTDEYRHIATEQMVPGTSVFGISITPQRMVPSTEKVLISQGNKVVNVSPYRFFPDTRYPLSRFQEGEFCASEDEVSRTELRKMEDAGDVAGIKHIKPLSEGQVKNWGGYRSTFVDIEGEVDSPRKAQGVKRDKDSILLTEMQMWIVPSEFKDDDGKPIGSESFPMMYNVWIANYNRVIKCEPMGYLHNSFTYDVGQFLNDMHTMVSDGIPEMVSELQNVVNWFVNSHIYSVRQIIDNRLIVDPAGVELAQLKNRSPLILLRKGAAMQGVDHWVKQLQLQDVTGRHMEDAQLMMRFVEVLTGINENSQGQFHGGRRSAYEARAVTQGFSTRMKTNATVLWDSLDSLGKKMLVNLRFGLEQEMYEAMVGDVPVGDPVREQEWYDGFMRFKSEPKKLARMLDYFPMDGTLPSEKLFQAQALQELLVQIMSNPESAMLLRIDPRKMMQRLYELKGIDNMNQFALSDQDLAQMQQQQMMLNATAQQAASPVGTQPTPAGA